MLILILHLCSCLFLTGLIWTIQIVHYPTFKFVEPVQFHNFTKFHVKKISYIVAPLMVLELASALYLLRVQANLPIFINLIFLLLIWLSTFFLSIPCHDKLLKQFDLSIIEKLIQTNWPRTILWSLRSLLLMTYSLYTVKV